MKIPVQSVLLPMAAVFILGITPIAHSKLLGTGSYEVVFKGLDSAVQAPDYITYTLVETVNECADFCNSVPTCGFFNSFHDASHNHATLLSCALYVHMHDTSDATNHGGQTQPDGSLNFIRDSSGYGKTVSIFIITQVLILIITIRTYSCSFVSVVAL